MSHYSARWTKIRKCQTLIIVVVKSPSCLTANCWVCHTTWATMHQDNSKSNTRHYVCLRHICRLKIGLHSCWRHGRKSCFAEYSLLMGIYTKMHVQTQAHGRDAEWSHDRPLLCDVFSRQRKNLLVQCAFYWDSRVTWPNLFPFWAYHKSRFCMASICCVCNWWWTSLCVVESFPHCPFHQFSPWRIPCQ